MKAKEQQSCKNISLNLDECTFYKNGTLTTPYSDYVFNFSAYENKTDSVHLCFPFDYSFLRCTKWKFNPGELYFNISDRTLTYNLSHESFTVGNYSVTSDNSMFTCVPISVLPPTFNFDEYFVILWTISVVSLMITISLYLLQKTSKNYFRPALYHMISLLLSDLGLILYQMPSIWLSKWKYYISFGIIYFGLTAYAWLNAIGYDAQKQFTPKNLLVKSSITVRGFIYRSIYGWGVPMILMIIIAIPESLGCCKRSGDDRCGIKPDLLNYIVLLGGGGTIIVVNYILFGLVIYNLLRIRKELSILNSDIHNVKNNLRVYIKLFTVMGPSFISIALGITYGPSNVIYFMFSDSLVALQGFFLFFIYGFDTLSQKLRKLLSSFC